MAEWSASRRKVTIFPGANFRVAGIQPGTGAAVSSTFEDVRPGCL